MTDFSQLPEDVQEYIQEAKEWITSLLTNKPLPNGEWPHLPHCSGGRKMKPGERGNSCCCRPVQPSPWIKVEEHLPDKFTPVVVSSRWEPLYSSRSRCQTVAWLNDKGEWVRHTSNGGTWAWKGHITYWMRIPQTPDEV